LGKLSAVLLLNILSTSLVVSLLFLLYWGFIGFSLLILAQRSHMLCSYFLSIFSLFLADLTSLSSIPGSLVSTCPILLVRLSTECLFRLLRFSFPRFQFDFLFRISVSLLNFSFILCNVFLFSFCCLYEFSFDSYSYLFISF
jgi:hypothetical protein